MVGVGVGECKEECVGGVAMVLYGIHSFKKRDSTSRMQDKMGTASDS